MTEQKKPSLNQLKAYAYDCGVQLQHWTQKYNEAVAFINTLTQENQSASVNQESPSQIEEKSIDTPVTQDNQKVSEKPIPMKGKKK